MSSNKDWITKHDLLQHKIDVKYLTICSQNNPLNSLHHFHINVFSIFYLACCHIHILLIYIYIYIFIYHLLSPIYKAVGVLVFQRCLVFLYIMCHAYILCFPSSFSKHYLIQILVSVYISLSLCSSFVSKQMALN